ncbi:MAG: AMIN domain-containing protein [Gammaproteobacteria bacterium]|nr:AMIN domain-containing protein [Gammaproteobacteria bacterium]
MNKTHQLMQFMAKKLFKISLTIPVLLFCLNGVAAAEPNAIRDITYNSLPGNRIQIHIDFNQSAEKPLSFTIDNPARIAFDFNNTISQLEQRKLPIGLGIAQSVTTVTAKEKTRVILNLTETVPYQIN